MIIVGKSVSNGALSGLQRRESTFSGKLTTKIDDGGRYCNTSSCLPNNTTYGRNYPIFSRKTTGAGRDPPKSRTKPAMSSTQSFLIA